jgi:hypothetical protein
MRHSLTVILVAIVSTLATSDGFAACGLWFCDNESVSENCEVGDSFCRCEGGEVFEKPITGCSNDGQGWQCGEEIKVDAGNACKVCAQRVRTIAENTHCGVNCITSYSAPLNQAYTDGSCTSTITKFCKDRSSYDPSCSESRQELLLRGISNSLLK